MTHNRPKARIAEQRRNVATLSRAAFVQLPYLASLYSWNRSTDEVIGRALGDLNIAKYKFSQLMKRQALSKHNERQLPFYTALFWIAIHETRLERYSRIL